MSLPLIFVMHNNIAVLWARKRWHIFECGSIIPCILWYSLCYQNVSASAEPTHLETWLDQLKSIMQLLFPFDPFYLFKLPAFFGRVYGFSNDFRESSLNQSHISVLNSRTNDYKMHTCIHSSCCGSPVWKHCCPEWWWLRLLW